MVFGNGVNSRYSRRRFRDGCFGGFVVVDLGGSSTRVVARGAASEISSVLWFVSAIELPVAGFSAVRTEIFVSSAIFFFLGEFLKFLGSRGCVRSVDGGRVGWFSIRGTNVCLSSVGDIGLVVHSPNLVEFFS